MNKHRINVLHVEDEPIQRVLVRSHLESMADIEFNVEEAESEESAINRIRSGGVDLVLLDYQLAEGDGLSCLKAIRSLDSRLPVIALSGIAAPEIVEDLLDFGADDFLSKEKISRDLLVQSVRSAITRFDAWKRRASGSRRHGVDRSDRDCQRIVWDLIHELDERIREGVFEIERTARRQELDSLRFEEIVDLELGSSAEAGGSSQPCSGIRLAIVKELVGRLSSELVRGSRSGAVEACESSTRQTPTFLPA
jgi:CheY-like chemotaxis protein